MTIQQMHNRLNLRIQKVNSNAFDDFLSEEIDEFLNIAIDRFIKDKFEPRSNQLGLGFEQSIKRIEDLRAIIKTSEIDTSEVTQTFFENIFVDKADLPEDFFLGISVALKVAYDTEGITYTVVSSKRTPSGDEDTDYATRRTRGKFFQHDDLFTLLEDPFNKPKIKVAPFTVESGSIYVYTDDKFLTDKVVLTYIRQPATVSLSGATDCDLSENVHNDIVDIAAQLILSDIGALGPEAQFASLNDSE